MINNPVSQSKTVLYLACARLFTLALIGLFISACDGDDVVDNVPSCDTYSASTAECFCEEHPDDKQCKTYFETQVLSEKAVSLTPHTNNGTFWCRGFSIANSIYVIDRESGTPHKFWKYIKESDSWEQLASFPGTKYGLVGAANGKGYASGYASKKFWEYDPSSNQWNPLSDLPFAPGDVHWVKYENKFYLPTWNGVYEFDPATKAWTSIYEKALQGTFDAIFLLGSTLYWFDLNGDNVYSFDLSTQVTNSYPFPEDFAVNTAFTSPFVLGNNAYIVNNTSVWIFDPQSNTWAVEKNVLTQGAYAKDAMVIDNTAYLVDSGYVISFSVTKK